MMPVRLSVCVAVLALAVALGGQAWARDLPPIKTVGVVSDVGDKIALTHIGFMVFSNKRSEAEFPDRQLDAFITGEIEAAPSQRGQAQSINDTGILHVELVIGFEPAVWQDQRDRFFRMQGTQAYSGTPEPPLATSTESGFCST